LSRQKLGVRNRQKERLGLFVYFARDLAHLWAKALAATAGCWLSRTPARAPIAWNFEQAVYGADVFTPNLRMLVGGADNVFAAAPVDHPVRIGPVEESDSQGDRRSHAG
jgi:hypothetical protein